MRSGYLPSSARRCSVCERASRALGRARSRSARRRRESQFKNGIEQQNLNNKLVGAFIKRVELQTDSN